MRIADKRLSILGPSEIEALYGRPQFTPEERLEYFSLSPREIAVLEQFHTTKSKLVFVLQLGYFKARHMFFLFNGEDVEEDREYIQRKYFTDAAATDLQLAKGTRLRQQKIILAFCKYRYCDAAMRKRLTAKARQAATICSRPIYVFREVMQYAVGHHIVIPAYSVMQDIVGNTLSIEQDRLARTVTQYLGAKGKSNLKYLLNESGGLHEITMLKHEPKDFSPGELLREVQREQQLRDLYQLATRVLPRLQISNENIKYYASLVTYYSFFRLKQLSERTVLVYLLCFIWKCPKHC